jgi:hypothetical protein
MGENKIRGRAIHSVCPLYTHIDTPISGDFPMATDHNTGGHTGSSADQKTDKPEQNVDGSPDANVNESLRMYMDSIEQAKRTLAVEILPALVACGVANVELAYSGCGDSGAIDGVQYRDAAGLRVVRDNIPQGIREKLETCAYAFLPPGFEINDGGQGTMTIDLPTRKITLRHEQNELVARQSTREWTV